MFRSIWEGIKWFFSVKEKTHNKISRKHGFSHIKAEVEPPVKVYGKPEIGSSPLKDTHDRMVKLKKTATMTSSESDTIESAKKDLWMPSSIDMSHKEFILSNCGFQRTVRQGNDVVFDPRLIQVINYAMNMYQAELVHDTEELLRKNSIVE
jgi:hypothetical protein